jgi:hypothetical protein
MSDDDLMDAWDYYDTMRDPNPDNEDQRQSDMNLIKKELNKRGFNMKEGWDEWGDEYDGKYAVNDPNFRHSGPSSTEYIATADGRYPDYSDIIFYDHAAGEYLIYNKKAGGSYAAQFDDLSIQNKAIVKKFGKVFESTDDGPVEINYLQGTDSKPKRKKFKNQADLEKWLDKNEGDIEILGYSTDEKTKEKSMILEITEEIQLPGTDIILEAGDKIEILSEGFEEMDMAADMLTDSNDEFGNEMERFAKKVAAWADKRIKENPDLDESEIWENISYQVQELIADDAPSGIGALLIHMIQ